GSLHAAFDAVFWRPLATVHSYQGPHTPLFGIPFYAIVKGTILYPAPWTNLVLDFAWIGLVLAGAMAMFLNPQFRDYARDNPVEVLFAVPYLVLVFSYNYPVFARSNFARFAIPTLPIVFVALARWMPPESQNSVGAGCGQANSCRALRARHQKRAP